MFNNFNYTSEIISGVSYISIIPRWILVAVSNGLSVAFSYGLIMLILIMIMKIMIVIIPIIKLIRLMIILIMIIMLIIIIITMIMNK